MKKDRKEYFKNYYKENKERIQQYYYDNKEYKLEKVKKYSENNKERKALYNKKYFEENKEKIILYNKNYFQENKKRLDEYSKIYSEENKERIKEYQKNYRRKRLPNDNLFRLGKNIRTLIYHSFKNNGYKKASKTFEIIGCSFEEFRLYLESKFEPWMNWDNHGLYNGEFNYGWDIDHIIPIISAKNEQDIVKLNHFSNLQPLCSKINRYVKRNIIDDTVCLCCGKKLVNKKYCNDKCRKKYYYMNEKNTETEEIIDQDIPKEEVDWKDKYIRLYAEMENYKKRHQKDKELLTESLTIKSMEVILDLDNDLSIALKSIKDEELLNGINLIIKKVKDTLKHKGIEEIQVDKYDENIHEVISVIENGENRIGEVISKGYYLNGKIIRYPKVILFK